MSLGVLFSLEEAHELVMRADQAVSGYTDFGNLATLSATANLTSGELTPARGPRTRQRTLTLLKIGLVLLSLTFFVFAVVSYRKGDLNLSRETAATGASDKPALNPTSPAKNPASNSRSEPAPPASKPAATPADQTPAGPDGPPRPVGKGGKPPFIDVLWFVQIATPTTPNNILRRLESKGYAARVVTSPQGTAGIHLVQIGPFKTESEADSIAARLRIEEQFNTSVTRRLKHGY